MIIIRVASFASMEQYIEHGRHIVHHNGMHNVNGEAGVQR